MAAKYHPTPLSGGDRKALAKELTKARAMTRILADRANEKRVTTVSAEMKWLSSNAMNKLSRTETETSIPAPNHKVRAPERKT
jgi:hypothetical protein